LRNRDKASVFGFRHKSVLLRNTMLMIAMLL
jgi:hypothetical protein